MYKCIKVYMDRILTKIFKACDKTKGVLFTFMLPRFSKFNIEILLRPPVILVQIMNWHNIHSILRVMPCPGTLIVQA